MRPLNAHASTPQRNRAWQQSRMQLHNEQAAKLHNGPAALPPRRSRQRERDQAIRRTKHPRAHLQRRASTR